PHEHQWKCFVRRYHYRPGVGSYQSLLSCRDTGFAPVAIAICRGRMRENTAADLGIDPTWNPGAAMLGSGKIKRMFQGLRTAIYHVNDLDKAKAWYSEILGIQPYFDKPFYVGFNVGGYELGLHPDNAKPHMRPAGVVAYWGVKDANASLARLIEKGATH